MAMEEKFEQIEQYLDESMREDDRSAFETRLAQEVDLQEDLEFAKLLKKGGFNLGLKKEMEVFHEELFPEKSKRSRIHRWIPYAAAVLIFFSFIAYFYQSPKPKTENLASEYFEPFPNYVSMRSTPMDDNFTAGLKKYSLNQYDSAYHYLTRASVEEKKLTDLTFYKGISELALKKNYESITTFSSLLLQKTKYDQQVRWYLALAYLGQGKVDSCEKYLQQIELRDFNYDLAQELKEELKTK